jgi:type I restriction enzyme S subunit
LIKNPYQNAGEIAEIVRGGSPRPAGDKRYYEGEIPFLKVADLTASDEIYLHSHTYTIKEAGLHKTRMVEADTLMLTNSGATLGIPKICTFQTTFNDGIAALLKLSFMNKKFLYYFLKSKSQWYLETASRGQGQPNLNTDIISNTPLALPPLAEQERIVAKLEKLMKVCDDLQTSINQSKSYANSLLQIALKEALTERPISQAA